MRPVSIDFLASAGCARVLGNSSRTVEGVKIDSREAGEGDLFVCVVGEINDGHDYVDGAYANGCRIFLMSEQKAADAVLFKDPSVCVLMAEDTQIAF
nr:hypothetical protein [Clostridia bacterium]